MMYQEDQETKSEKQSSHMDWWIWKAERKGRTSEPT